MMLDGLTLFRYAHICRERSSGGVEQYLKQLNDRLLANNRMTILQMHLVPAASTDSPLRIEVEKRGLGQIIWIPVCFHSYERSLRSLPDRLRVLAASRTFGPARGKRSLFATLRSALANWCGHMRYSEMILSETLRDALDTYAVDLIVFHWLSYDVGTVVSLAAKRRIPYAIVHHFDNARLGLARTRRWIQAATAIGSVNRRNVPLHIKRKFTELSDAIDQSFLTPQRAVPVARPKGFVVLLPARVIQGKGHVDLLMAAQRLVRQGSPIAIAFAGAIESKALKAELEKKASLCNMGQHVTFLGELTSERLRDWYAQSDVVVLPSSSEGLPRVLLEAQAMGKPVIAYETGGMPDALIANKTGFLVKSGDYEALGERIKYLIDNPQQRLAMGESGRRFVSETFSLPALVARHEDFYARVLSA